MSVVASRLETLMDQMPKEGAKAAVALGVVERIKEIIEAANRAASLVECIGQARGTCKDSYCDPACARIIMIKNGDTVRLGKYHSNTIGVTIEPGRVVLATERAKLIVDSSGVVKALLLGIEEEANIADVDDLYKKSYIIKRVVREVGGRIDVIVSNLQACARANALVC